MNGITITLPKQKERKLTKLALSYGLSLPEFSRFVLEELSSKFPEEPFEDYENPKALKASFNRALKDLSAGRVYEKL